MLPIDLRPYQASAIQSLRSSLGSGLKRQLMYAPTGAGKSVILEALTRSAIAKGKRVVIIANRIHLIRQLEERFTASGIHHGVLQGENSHTTHAPVIIASIQTVARRGLPPFDLILIDEAHACAGSKDYRKVIFANGLMPIIGVTATPFSKGLGKSYKELGDEPLFQSLVVAATIRELIDDGYLVDCDIFAPTTPDMTGIKTQRNAFGEIDYVDSDVARAVDTPHLVGDIVQHWHRLANNQPTICFASSIDHSKHIVQAFNDSGVSAKHIDCYMEPEEKDAILADFKAGKFKLLSNVALVAEGFDYPECGVMILARPTKSLIRYIQMAGRVLRVFHGKDRALILDHSGSCHNLGYPTDDLPLELDDGKAKESSAREKKEALPKECPSCKFMKAPKQHKCPKCGFEPVRPPDLIEVVPGELSLIERIKAAKQSKFDKQEAWSQLLSIRHERGYTTGWASHKYRELFGVWPRGLEDVCIEPTIDMRNWIKGGQIRYAKRIEKEQRHAA